MWLILLFPLGVSGCLSLKEKPQKQEEFQCEISRRLLSHGWEETGSRFLSWKNSKFGNLLSFFGNRDEIPNRPRHSDRIINGKISGINEFPYQVSLHADIGEGDTYYCGGFIIGKEFVVTAAHCVSEPLTFTVRAGSSFHSRGGARHAVSRMWVHPRYNDSSSDFDVAVLRVTPPLAPSDAVKPVPLAAAPADAPPSAVAVTSGWGSVNAQVTNMSDHLLKVKVPLMSKNDCKRSYGRLITPRMLCAGYREGGHDACQGDSGGPLAYNGKVVGIVSWGFGCGMKNCPGVYTNISTVRDWILKISGV